MKWWWIHLILVPFGKLWSTGNTTARLEPSPVSRSAMIIIPWLTPWPIFRSAKLTTKANFLFKKSAGEYHSFTPDKIIFWPSSGPKSTLNCNNFLLHSGAAASMTWPMRKSSLSKSGYSMIGFILSFSHQERAWRLGYTTAAFAPKF